MLSNQSATELVSVQMYLEALRGESDSQHWNSLPRSPILPSLVHSGVGQYTLPTLPKPWVVKLLEAPGTQTQYKPKLRQVDGAKALAEVCFRPWFSGAVNIKQ